MPSKENTAQIATALDIPLPTTHSRFYCSKNQLSIVATKECVLLRIGDYSPRYRLGGQKEVDREKKKIRGNGSIPIRGGWSFPLTPREVAGAS
jgi:hypothetical protein